MFEEIITASYVITSIAYGIEIYNLFKYGDNNHTHVLWWAVNGSGSILALLYCSFNQPNDLMYRLITLFIIQISLCATCLTVNVYLSFKDSMVSYTTKDITLAPQIQNDLDTAVIYPEKQNFGHQFKSKKTCHCNKFA
jgi:hypothetical protein